MKKTPHIQDYDMPCVFVPQNSLRAKIGAGVPLDAIFTPEKLAKCKTIIDDANRDLQRDMEAQIQELGAEYMEAAQQDDPPETFFSKTANLAFSIKKSMESLGFKFGYEVAKSLYDYLLSLRRFDDSTLIIVCKHVSVLTIIIKNDLMQDGGATGQELLENLQVLVRKVG